MQNYNQQQTAITLKGIAQQMISMNMPSMNELNKLMVHFGYEVVHKETNDRAIQFLVKEAGRNALSEEFDPYEWLYNKYSIVKGQKICKKTGYTAKRELVQVRIADNVGHFRTEYPVVLVLFDGSSFETVTIEAIDLEAVTKASWY